MDFLSVVVHQLFGAEVKEAGAIAPLGGGCINNTGRFDLSGKTYFLKWNYDAHDLFEKEHKGLELLETTGSINVPEVIGRGEALGFDYLCLSHIEKGPSTSHYWENLGRSLASLHQVTTDRFGLDHDNHIGKLPQQNEWKEDWESFFVENRLMPQIKTAMNNGMIDQAIQRQFESFFTKINDFFPKGQPTLLHGDLWSGNVMPGPSHQPYIFDPAVYYGNREAELAFTKMFGGFDRQFYQSYSECFTLEYGFEDRVDLYNLYPLLVHVNLFGSSYLPPVLATLKRVV